MRSLEEREPSELLAAALLGLLGAGPLGCTENHADAPSSGECDAGALTAWESEDAGTADAGHHHQEVEEETVEERSVNPLCSSKVMKKLLLQYLSWAELVQRCEERGGYLQAHTGHCGYQNTCAGFSYMDAPRQPEGGELREHSCAGSNACTGISCVEAARPASAPPLSGEVLLTKSEELYARLKDRPGPSLQTCAACHAHQEAIGAPLMLKMYFWHDSERTVENWKDLPAAYQESVIAFGAQGVRPDGLAYSHMGAYNTVLSKQEIRAAVEYMRSVPPEKTKAITIEARPKHE